MQNLLIIITFCALISAGSLAADLTCGKVLSAVEYSDIRTRTEELIEQYRQGVKPISSLREFRALELLARTLFFEGDAEGTQLLIQLDNKLRNALNDSEKDDLGSRVPKEQLMALLSRGKQLIADGELAGTNREHAVKASQALTLFRADEVVPLVHNLSQTAPASTDYFLLNNLGDVVGQALAKLVSGNSNAPDGVPVVSGVKIHVFLMPDPRNNPDYRHPPRYPRGYDGRGGIL